MYSNQLTFEARILMVGGSRNELRKPAEPGSIADANTMQRLYLLVGQVYFRILQEEQEEGAQNGKIQTSFMSVHLNKTPQMV